MAKLFGFVQFDFAGRLALADGRYLVGTGDPSASDEVPEGDYVLVLKTIGAPPQPGAGAAAAEPPRPSQSPRPWP